MKGVPMASHSPSAHHPRTIEPRRAESGAFLKVSTILLGFGVSVLAFFALVRWSDARDSRGTATPATPAAEGSGASSEQAASSHDHNTALPIESFAGVVPANAQELAAAHKPYDAVLPAAP